MKTVGEKTLLTNVRARLQSRSGALLLSLILLVLIALWPVRTPVYVIEEAPQEPHFVVLTNTESRYSFQLPPISRLSGIELYTSRGFKPSAESQVSLFVRDDTNQQLRSVHTSFSSVINMPSRSARFSWRTLPANPPEHYTVQLVVADLKPEQNFPLRPAHTDFALPDTPVALKLYATKPALVALGLHIFAYDTAGEDISYYYHRGGQIVDGVNPYTCAKDNSCKERKNPGHFPLFYQISAWTQQNGFGEYDEWIGLWHPLFIGAWALIGIIIFTTLHMQGITALGFFGALFWYFGRWSLYVGRVGHIDFVAVLFVLLATILFKRVWWLALLALSISLATKQIAVFAVPLFLIAAWQLSPKNRVRRLIISMVLIGLLPIVSIIPFVLDDADGVLAGLLFSVTRDPGADLGAPSFDATIGTRGIGSIALMVVVMVSVYVAAYRHRLSLTAGLLLVFATFLVFNSVIFNQYFVWLMPFIPLGVGELLRKNDQRQHINTDTDTHA